MVILEYLDIFVKNIIMRIYSNSFFHFTNSIDSLKGIITSGFKVFYCKEEVFTQNRNPLHVAIPMVSFCDIPLSFLNKNNYGKICIGMSRPWGIKHELQPVMYYPNNRECLSTQIVMKAGENFTTDNNEESYRILGFSKPMYKIQPIHNLNKNNYIEREWRKVYKSYGSQKWKNEDDYNTYRGDANSNKIQVGSALRFSVNDIDCIIINKDIIDDFIAFVMDDLTMIGGKSQATITLQDRHKLLSKIILSESLKYNL